MTIDSSVSPKRFYQSLKEKSPLIPLSRRHPFVYLERCKIVRKDNDVVVFSEVHQEAFALPVGSIGALLLGPGVSLSSESARIIVSRGCLINITGGESMPVYLISNQHRSPLPRLRQHRVVFDPQLRQKGGITLFQFRSEFVRKHCPAGFPEFSGFSDQDSIEVLLAKEGAWAKRAYAFASKYYSVNWMGKAEARGNAHPIVFLNHLSYSIADLAILHLGFDPNIGILHGRTRGGGLCYDLADIIKPLLALCDSFDAIKNEKSMTDMKKFFLERVVELDLIDVMIKCLNSIFASESED